MSTTFANEVSMAEHMEGSLAERLQRLEGEVAELRHTMSDLADIVVADIKERREATLAVPSALPDLSIPAALVPGGQTTLNAMQTLRHPWLLFDLLGELRATFRMYFDVRYRMRSSTRIMVPIIFVLFGLNYLLFNYTLLDLPVFHQIMERLVEIVLAVLLYKVTSREVTRYRLVMAQTAVARRSWSPVPAALLHNDPDHAAVQRQESP